jgi:PAS domain S-box-containing protein
MLFLKPRKKTLAPGTFFSARIRPAGSWPARAGVSFWPAGFSRLCVAATLVAATAAFALDRTAQPANYTAAHWNAEDGLPHNSVKHLLQTSDGYLWIGTNQGLARFDGLTFTVFRYPTSPGLPNNQITSLLETRDGSLWIGTANGLSRYRDGTFTAYGKADGLKTETMNALCVAPDGSLWIGCREGITRWVDGKFVNDIDTTGYDLLAMRHIFRDRRDAMWVTFGAETLRYAEGKFTHFGPAEGLPPRQLQMIREDNEGRLLAVTQDGLYRFDGARFVPFELNTALSSPRVATALYDRAGNLWIGSVGGLDRFQDGKVAPYVDAHGDRLSGVDVLFEDREDCLWVGSSEGLARITDRRGYTLGKSDGVLGSSATAVRASSDGSIWIGSWAGGVARMQNGTVRQYAAGAPLSHESVTAIFEAPDGAMWFGNRGSSIDRLDRDGKVTTYVFKPGVATSRPVTALYSEPDGELLLGISRRGLLHLADGEITRIPEAVELTNETVWDIFRTRKGRLLIGTSKGLYERDQNRAWNLVKLPGLKSDLDVRAIAEDSSGVLWLGTGDLGLVRWNAAQARAYGTSEGMVDNTLFSVVDDGNGSLWVSSARGMARVRKADLAELDRGAVASLNCMTLGRADGLLSGASPGSGSPTAILLGDGRLLTATDKGVAVVDLRRLPVNTRPPTVVIESVIADDRPLPIVTGRAISVPSSTNRLEIRYTALSLIAPHRIRFRYQLVGSDPAVIEAGGDRSARYTHLSPGPYKFRVVASNNDGVWSETGATVALTLLPRFYQTLWFRIGAIVTGLAAIAFLASFRIRQLNRRHLDLARTNADLDQRVRERTAELSRSHAELQQRELLFRLIFEHAPVGVSWSRADLGPQYHFNSAFRRILDLPAETLPDNTLLAALAHPEDAARQAKFEDEIRTGQADSYAFEQRFVRRDGRQVSALLAVAVVRDEHGQVIQHIRILEDITALKQAEQELAQTYQRLMATSRQAGMAEIATGVLHNVGNVLNSVNVSATLVTDHVRETKAAGVAKLAALLAEHKTNLAEFFTQNPRGQKVPDYVASLAESIAAEHKAVLAELDHLRANIEHIKSIVAMQQSYARVSGVIEQVSVSEMIDDALRINAGSLAAHRVEAVRDFQSQPVVATDKHKVMQILVNLIRNAKEACDESGRPDKQIVVRTTNYEQCVKIAVIDNGVGIAPENLTRIFNHGFTTRKNGHGFGLHSGALAAREVGGSLKVQSEGPGCGATFILELPFKPAAAAEQKN